MCCFRRRHYVVHGGIGTPVADIFPDTHIKEESLLQHHPHLGAQRLQLDITHINAINQHTTLGSVVEARQQVDQRRLARPGGTNQSKGLTRCDLEGDVAQQRRVVVVGERNVLKGHAAFECGQDDRCRLVSNVCGRIQDQEHPLAGCPGLGGHLVEEADHAHGRPHGDGIGLEGDQAAERHVVADHLRGAKRQHEGLADGSSEILTREDIARLQGRLQPRLTHRVVHRIKAIRLVLLPTKSFDQLDGRCRLLNDRIDIRHTLLQRSPGRPQLVHLLLIEDDQGQHGQGDEGQAHVKEEHDRQVDDDRDDGIDQPGQAATEEALDGRHVVRHARHQLAGLIGVEEAHRLRLQVPVELVAHVEHDVLPQPLLQVPLEGGGGVGQQGHQQHRHGEHDNQLAVLLADAVIDDGT